MKKLNVVDVFIILVVALSLLGIGARIGTQAYLNSKNNIDFEMSLEISSVDESKKNAIQVGDIIRLGENGDEIGTIQSISFFEVVDSTPVQEQTEKKYDVLVSIIVSGKISDQGFFLEGVMPVYAGTTLNITSEGYNGEVMVVDIVHKNQ